MKKTIAFGILLSSALSAQTLRSLADDKGLNFGTPAIGRRAPVQIKGWYADTLKTHFNMVFPENALKFKGVQPKRGVFNWTYPDSILAFAKANGMKARGHELVWHSLSQNPKWLTDNLWSTSSHIWTRAELLSILKTHIDSVVGRYKGQILEWDVVNEPLADKFTPGVSPLRSTGSSFWMRIIGEEYIDSAFAWAHRADPSAYLYLNDYGIENDGSYNRAKSDSLYSLVKRLLARKVPIHGVGLEAHFPGPYVSKAGISTQIRRLGALGLRVSLTELDIRGTAKNPAVWGTVTAACLENFNCTSIATWGVDDSVSWYGTKSDCLLWDSLHQPKTKAINAVKLAFQSASDSIAALRKTFAALPPSQLGPNRVPLISMSCASNGLVAPATLNCTWKASDADGKLKAVQLLKDQKGVSITALDGATSSANGSFSVANLPAGTYSFLARAIDNQGKFGYSASLTVKVVANKAPVISMSCATTGLKAPATLKCNWKASDSDGTVKLVELLQDLVGVNYLPQAAGLQSATGVFEVGSLPEGTYKFVPKVTDNLGKVSYGTTIKVLVGWNYAFSTSGATNWYGGLYVNYALPASTASASAQLFTSNGTLVKTITLRPDRNSARFTSLSGYPTGNYTVRLVVNGKVVATQTVIKR